MKEINQKTIYSLKLNPEFIIIFFFYANVKVMRKESKNSKIAHFILDNQMLLMTNISFMMQCENNCCTSLHGAKKHSISIFKNVFTLLTCWKLLWYKFESQL